MKQPVAKALRYFRDSNYRFLINSGFGCYNSMPDEEYLRRKFKACMGRELDLTHPQTFNEKLQWLKLYDRKPEYTMMVDKYRVREYIKEKLGEEYLIPLLGVWDDPDEIDFDALPNRFVLKCNHNSGLGMCICKDKSKLDIPKVKAELRKGLAQDYYLTGREWPYQDVPRKIICEKFMEDENVSTAESRIAYVNGLIDYKFYCFSGEPKFLYVGFANINKNSKHDLLSFLELNWKQAPFYRKDHDPLPFKLKKPDDFDDMIRIASKLSQGIPFLRVDLYYLNQQIYFSELTFYPGSGFGRFYPDKWENKIGTWLNLPKKCT